MLFLTGRRTPSRLQQPAPYGNTESSRSHLRSRIRYTCLPMVSISSPYLSTAQSLPMASLGTKTLSTAQHSTRLLFRCGSAPRRAIRLPILLCFVYLPEEQPPRACDRKSPVLRLTKLPSWLSATLVRCLLLGLSVCTHVRSPSKALSWQQQLLLLLTDHTHVHERVDHYLQEPRGPRVPESNLQPTVP